MDAHNHCCTDALSLLPGSNFRLRVLAGLPAPTAGHMPTPSVSTFVQGTPCTCQPISEPSNAKGHRQYPNGTRCFLLRFIKQAMPNVHKCVSVTIRLAHDLQHAITYYGSGSNLGKAEEEQNEICLDEGEYLISTNITQNTPYVDGFQWTLGILVGAFPAELNFSISDKGMATDHHSLESSRGWSCGTPPPAENGPPPVEDTFAPMRCYKWWRGEEPVLPTTGADQCGGYASFSLSEECSAEETHCW